ncbi:8139_t:CDS:2 [Funneliformis geosporum]|uniref:8139_t:CDS:1 n=1 Tax=Funneliformis geosporum TaxID=1117311 RepID=A0A9W4T0L4_9GLOM|nr:8139_t:CDS:2 [Funneliformis geosporum]
MNDNLIIIPFPTPETSENQNKIRKKREPNIFITYRNEMMKKKPLNMTMTEYSKLVSDWWRKIPEYEKAKRKRQYQINRDQKQLLNEKWDPRDTRYGFSAESSEAEELAEGLLSIVTVFVANGMCSVTNRRRKLMSKKIKNSKIPAGKT